MTAIDTLPTGMTATAVSGTGWNCTLGTLTCTRSDALSASSSYPALTLTVTVSGSAAASLTNSVSVSGGGESNTSNDSASDVTTISQLPGPDHQQEPQRQFHSGTDRSYLHHHSKQRRGTGSTSGTVTAIDTLPTGMTATAISGTESNCTLGTLTCTRSDCTLRQQQLSRPSPSP